MRKDNIVRDFSLSVFASILATYLYANLFNKN